MFLFKSKAEKFFCAIDFGNIKKIEKMLKKGIDANINIGGDWIYPVIMSSYGSGKQKVVELLLKYGADPNACDHYGRTALHYCVEYDHPQIVKMLLEAGADVNAKTENGLTPLHFCIEYNRPQIAEILFEAGPDLNVKTVNGYGLAESTITFNRPDFFTMLIAHGLKIDLKNTEGGKLLSYAFECNSVQMANYLLMKGANILHQNDDQFFLLDIAIQSKNAQIRLAAKREFENLITKVVEWDVSELDKFISVRASLEFQKLCFQELLPLFIERHKTEHSKLLFDAGAIDTFESIGDKVKLIKALITNSSRIHDTIVEDILNADPQLISPALGIAKYHKAENAIQFIQKLENKVKIEQENERKADALQKEQDQKMIDFLKRLCSAYATDDPSYHQLELEATRIGEQLDAQGGIAAMRRVFAHVQGSPGSRTLEMHWSGIGEWRG